MQKRRDFVTGSMRPVNRETISIIDAVLGPMGEDSYRAALEIASHELDPLTIVQDLIGIQQYVTERSTMEEVTYCSFSGVKLLNDSCFFLSGFLAINIVDVYAIDHDGATG